MTYKCEYKLRCVEWEDDTIRCCLFYKYCRSYKEFKAEEKDKYKIEEMRKKRGLTCWENIDEDVRNGGTIISR